MTEEPQWTAWKAFLESIIENDVRQVIREEEDIHSGFSWEKYLSSNLKSHFNGRRVRQSDSLQFFVDADDIWSQTSYSTPYTGLYSLPKGYSYSNIYSKKSFKYGITSLLTMPSQDASHFIGFVARPSRIAAWYIYSDRLGININWNRINVTNVQPTDYLTEEHQYEVVVTKFGALFYLDYVLRAIGYYGPTGLATINGPPYYIVFGSRPPVYTDLMASIESWGGDSNADRNISITISGFLIVEGDPLPSLDLNLYDAGTDTLFTDLTIAAGSETSHPFPLFGYEGKTIYFQADQAGNFNIEVLDQTGNWRVHSTIAFLVNTLSVTTITDEALIGRIVVTPTAFPCNISTAEVILR